MKLIVGLGNPGKEYEHTRHNIGFRVVDQIPKAQHLLILKPDTFMNLSGKAVLEQVNFYKIDPSKDLLIISDDKDMLFGKIRFRSEGSSGGHKGLQSIIDHLGTHQFARLKIGVGHADQTIPTDAFVLQKFTKEEEDQLSEVIEAALKKVQAFLTS